MVEHGAFLGVESACIGLAVTTSVSCARVVDVFVVQAYFRSINTNIEIDPAWHLSPQTDEFRGIAVIFPA